MDQGTGSCRLGGGPVGARHGQNLESSLRSSLAPFPSVVAGWGVARGSCGGPVGQRRRQQHLGLGLPVSAPRADVVGAEKARPQRPLDSIKEYRKIKAHQTEGSEQKSWQAKANDEADRLAKLGRLMHKLPAEATVGGLNL